MARVDLVARILIWTKKASWAWLILVKQASGPTPAAIVILKFVATHRIRAHRQDVYWAPLNCDAESQRRHYATGCRVGRAVFGGGAMWAG